MNSTSVASPAQSEERLFTEEAGQVSYGDSFMSTGYHYEEPTANSIWASGLENWLQAGTPYQEIDPFRPNEIVWQMIEQKAAEELFEKRQRMHRRRLEVPEVLPDRTHS